MNEERLNAEEIIEETQNAELNEFVYDDEGVECQESEYEETDKYSVIRAILKKVGAVFVVVGTTIVLFKCKGCLTKWAVRMLEKRGFTVIQPGKNVTIIEEAIEDDDQIDQDQEPEEFEETEE